MMMKRPRLEISAAPHLPAIASTPRIMWSVVVCLLPLVLAAGYFFGISALLVIAVATAGALLPERVLGRLDPAGRTHASNGCPS